MQHRMVDCENLKTFPELAWKVQLAGQNYPGEFIIYYITDFNYHLHGFRVNGLLFYKPIKNTQKPKANEKGKKLVCLTPKTVLDQLTVGKKGNTCPKKDSYLAA